LWRVVVVAAAPGSWPWQAAVHRRPPWWAAVHKRPLWRVAVAAACWGPLWLVLVVAAACRRPPWQAAVASVARRSRTLQAAVHRRPPWQAAAYQRPPPQGALTAAAHQVPLRLIGGGRLRRTVDGSRIGPCRPALSCRTRGCAPASRRALLPARSDGPPRTPRASGAASPASPGTPPFEPPAGRPPTPHPHRAFFQPGTTIPPVQCGRTTTGRSGGVTGSRPRPCRDLPTTPGGRSSGATRRRGAV